MNSNDANRLLKLHGAKKLLKSDEGRRIIEKAKEKYKTDLLQPGDPEFMKHWGHKVIADKLAREKNEQKAKDMWGAVNERKAWEAQQRVSEGTDWKSKRL